MARSDKDRVQDRKPNPTHYNEKIPSLARHRRTGRSFRATLDPVCNKRRPLMRTLVQTYRNGTMFFSIVQGATVLATIAAPTYDAAMEKLSRYL